ncbi:MAG: polyphosphate kinase 2 family protein [Eubacteriales bacterium]|nr:polyphosphate kinase 2 family protein [Eubacteriales bacterium]
MAKDSINNYKFIGKSKFNISKFKTDDTGEFTDRAEAVDEFVHNLLKINKLQQRLYAERKEGVIFIFQAMDAAGKDGVIRTVFNTLSPHGVKEFCFKVPSSEEASHDYLWRFWSALPPRGSISIFNRSYYEDVLVGKVHRLYEKQVRPDRLNGIDIIEQRYGQINDYENYLYNTGTRIVKIFLNVSKDEQARRFISRIDIERKNWKISSGDIKEREFWDDYMEAFETMVNKTSTSDCPWYVVPADHKWYARLLVSRIVLQTLEEIDPQWPVISDEELETVQEFRNKLEDSLSGGYIEPEQQLPQFANPGVIAANIVENEERAKIVEKIARRKERGFDAVYKLLDDSPVIGSLDAIIEAVAYAEEKAKDTDIDTDTDD